jgi:hypothetical protein
MIGGQIYSYIRVSSTFPLSIFKVCVEMVLFGESPVVMSGELLHT